jgi:hypothetical protein
MILAAAGEFMGSLDGTTRFDLFANLVASPELLAD